MTDPDAIFDDLSEACGKAIGFALAAALRSREDFSHNDGLRAFAQHLEECIDNERFSPQVSVVMNGITDGLLAFTNAGAAGGEFC